jgi:TonB family protein
MSEGATGMTFRIERPLIALLAVVATLSVGAPLQAQTTDGHMTVSRTAPSTAVSGTHDCAGYYPELSRRLNQTGDVLVSYDVLADGTLTHVHILRSSGIVELDRAALLCVSQRWRNLPAMRDGVLIASPGHRAIIRFQLNGSASAFDLFAMNPFAALNLLFWLLGLLTTIGLVGLALRQWAFGKRVCPKCSALNRSIVPLRAPTYCSACGTKFSPQP